MRGPSSGYHKGNWWEFCNDLNVIVVVWAGSEFWSVWPGGCQLEDGHHHGRSECAGVFPAAYPTRKSSWNYRWGGGGARPPGKRPQLSSSTQSHFTVITNMGQPTYCFNFVDWFEQAHKSQWIKKFFFPTIFRPTNFFLVQKQLSLFIICCCANGK